MVPGRRMPIGMIRIILTPGTVSMFRTFHIALGGKFRYVILSKVQSKRLSISLGVKSISGTVAIESIILSSSQFSLLDRMITYFKSQSLVVVLRLIIYNFKLNRNLHCHSYPNAALHCRLKLPLFDTFLCRPVKIISAGRL